MEVVTHSSRHGEATCTAVVQRLAEADTFSFLKQNSAGYSTLNCYLPRAMNRSIPSSLVDVVGVGSWRVAGRAGGRLFIDEHLYPNAKFNPFLRQTNLYRTGNTNHSSILSCDNCLEIPNTALRRPRTCDSQRLTDFPEPQPP